MENYDNKYFINRELSWLDFNYRVLQEAMDSSNPLLERFKFLTIFSTNLDEFFMVRVGGLKEQLDFGYSERDIAGYTPKEQLELICEKVRDLVNKQYSCFIKNCKPELTESGIMFASISELTMDQEAYLQDYFKETIFPILTPMGIDAGRPFPLLYNKTINIVVRLEDQEGGRQFSVVQVPSIINRFLKIPSKTYHRYVLLEDIIMEYIQDLFEGYTILEKSTFRITRNADMTIDEEEADDLLIKIENSIKERRWGSPVRLEIDKDMPQSLKSFLVESIGIAYNHVFEIAGPIDLGFLMDFSRLDGYESLRFEKFFPYPVPEFFDKKDMFKIIRKKDVMLHHPYQSFDPVLDFVKRAGNDANVLAIKQTLYRVSGNSPIVNALIKAAENGKQVTVLVELKARFDEERNIAWAKKLEKAGCHVVYGLVGLKIHAKILLVVRREDDGIRRYAHFSTGNYNDSTAKLYTDIGMFTSKENLCADASSLFNVLTGFSSPKHWNKLSVAPYTLRQQFNTLIDAEIEHAQNGREARIIIKANSLVDEGIISALYDASRAGVEIQLIIRGICCLKAGIKGVSENITVRSIVGKYLEHSRIYYFHNGGRPRYYISSADWMTRNLDRRIEALIPVEQEDIQDEFKHILDVTWNDCVKGRQMRSDGSYERIACGENPVNSQEYFCERSKMLIKKVKDKRKEDVIDHMP